MLEITDNFEKMVTLGQQYLEEHPEAYPENYETIICECFKDILENLAKIRERHSLEKLPEIPESRLRALVDASVYCQQMYGTSLTEFNTFEFKYKTHEEKTQYITWDSRFLYMAFLNKDCDNHFLDNKFEAYNLLKPFYKRDAMLLADENDFEAFKGFVQKHPDIFVKPNNLELAEGTHRLVYDKDGDLHETFKTLLQEASELTTEKIKREIDHKLILEEFITPSEFIRELNPDEMSLLRVTTIFIKGKVHFFYPLLRLLIGNGVTEIGEDYSYVALIDPENGKVISNGKHSLGEIAINPVTGKPILGMQLPDWEDLKQMLTEACQMLPDTRYIGWDVTHTDKGWCIIEGNTNGEFFYQMAVGHGVKDEFESIIGFKVPWDFWKSPLFRKRNK